MRKNILKSLVAGAVILAASAGAQAYTITLGNNAYTFDQIDWSSGGSAWVSGYTGVVGSSFTLNVMANATALLNGNTNAYSFGGTGSPELTLYASLTETIVGEFANFQFFSLNAGTWNVYYDSIGNSNLLTGVGFTDGTNILGGTFTPGASGSFSVTGMPGTNSGGSGSQVVTGYIDHASGAITPTPTDSTAATLLQLGNLTTAWVQPTGFSAATGGGTDATYDPLGTWTSNPAYLSNGQEVFQADANQSFSGKIPEPASLALLGLGLAALAVRRKA